MTRGPQPILEVAVGSVLDAVPTARSASVLLLDRRGRPFGGSTTDRATATLDQAQVTLGEGPAVDATTDLTITQDNDLRHSTRWPRWLALALGAGHHSVVSVPLRTRRVVGAVTVYGGAGALPGRPRATRVRNVPHHRRFRALRLPAGGGRAGRRDATVGRGPR